MFLVDGVPEPGRAVLPHCYRYAPPLTQKDYLELYLLRERFGVEPPQALLENVLAAAREEHEA